MRREIDPLHALFDRLTGRLAGSVEGVGGPTELDHPLVDLLHPHQIGLKPRRLADAEDEQAGGERIERAGMPDFLDVGAAAELLHGFLVDEQQAVDGWFGRLHGYCG